MLTANYMPEYGRASGGQIRFVTKSGSSRYTGSGSFFYRDESLQANTWTRNRSTNPVESSGPAPFDFKQYGYAFGGPIPGRPLHRSAVLLRRAGVGRLLRARNQYRDGADRSHAPRRLQRAAQSRTTASSPARGRSSTRSPGSRSRATSSPRTGSRRTAWRFCRHIRCRRPGFRQGTANLIQTSDNPRDQRKDTIRLDFRLSSAHQLTYRYSASGWTAIDAFRPATGFPFARTDWRRPNSTQIVNWTATLRNNLLNETSYSFSLDEVFIDVFTDLGPAPAQPQRHQLSVHLSGQGDRGQAADDRDCRLHDDRRRSVSRVLARPDSRLHQHDHMAERAAYAQSRRHRRVLGRGRFRPDQRRRDSWRDEQSEWLVRIPRQPRRRLRAVGRQRRTRAVQQLR